MAAVIIGLYPRESFALVGNVLERKSMLFHATRPTGEITILELWIDISEAFMQSVHVYINYIQANGSRSVQRCVPNKLGDRGNINE